MTKTTFIATITMAIMSSSLMLAPLSVASGEASGDTIRAYSPEGQDKGYSRYYFRRIKRDTDGSFSTTLSKNLDNKRGFSLEKERRGQGSAVTSTENGEDISQTSNMRSSLGNAVINQTKTSSDEYVPSSSSELSNDKGRNTTWENNEAFFNSSGKLIHGDTTNQNEFGNFVNDVLGDRSKQTYNAGNNDWAKSDGGSAGLTINDFLNFSKRKTNSQEINKTDATFNNMGFGMAGTEASNFEDGIGDITTDLLGTEVNGQMISPLTGMMNTDANGNVGYYDKDGKFHILHTNGIGVFGLNGERSLGISGVAEQAGIDGMSYEVGNASTSFIVGLIDKKDSVLQSMTALGSDILGFNDNTTMSDQELFQVAKKILYANGYDLNAIVHGKSYDEGSFYTDPEVAWDMNRITKLLKLHKIDPVLDEVKQ